MLSYLCARSFQFQTASSSFLLAYSTEKILDAAFLHGKSYLREFSLKCLRTRLQKIGLLLSSSSTWQCSGLVHTHFLISRKSGPLSKTPAFDFFLFSRFLVSFCLGNRLHILSSIFVSLPCFSLPS